MNVFKRPFLRLRFAVKMNFAESDEDLRCLQRIEANLPGTSSVTAKLLLQMPKKKIFDLDNEDQSGAHHDGAQWCHSMGNIFFLRQLSPFSRYYISISNLLP